jgi:hypothetical protein
MKKIVSNYGKWTELEGALQDDNNDDRLQAVLNDKSLVTDKIQTC